jgi:hypothetical protein
MKTRKIILFTIAIICYSQLMAQDKVEQYCKVLVITYKEGKADQISIDYGKKHSSLNQKNTAMIVEMEKVNEFTSGIDALNYMGNLGWVLITITPRYFTNGHELGRQEFFFKKLIDK